MKVDALGRRKRAEHHPPSKKTRSEKLDKPLLELLRRYRWLPSTYLSALLNRSQNSLAHRLTTLHYDRQLIFIPSESWGKLGILTQPAVYGLTPYGEEVAGEALKFGNKLKHDLLGCIWMASLELGAKKHGLPYFTWDELKQSPSCSTDNWMLPLARGKLLEPDWPPFAIGKPRYYFYGVEIDRDTETAEGEAHKTLTRMFEDYFEILENQSYKTLGIPRFLIPIITINNTRMNLMIKTLKQVAKGRRTDAFIFTVVPDILTEFYNFPPPSGDLLSRDWVTTTGTFNILEKLGGGANGRSQTRTHSGAEATA